MSALISGILFGVLVGTVISMAGAPAHSKPVRYVCLCLVVVAGHVLLRSPDWVAQGSRCLVWPTKPPEVPSGKREVLGGNSV